MYSCDIEEHNSVTIPTRVINSLRVKYEGTIEDVKVPLSTFEKPLWFSVRRGAYLAGLCGGINTFVTSNCMTRSVVFKCKNIEDCIKLNSFVEANIESIEKQVKSSSRHAEFLKITSEIVGNLIYFRLSINAKEASGHNMVTNASQQFVNWVVQNYNCECVSVSGNCCVDKKVSAINSICGRGKNVHADLVVPEYLCKRILRTTPQKMHELNTVKNLIGSTLAGSIMSSNAHYANMLLAIYLATGQDAANIVEGSQGITVTDVVDGNLYFSVNLPNVIVGTVGNGKNEGITKQNLEMMNCVGDGSSEKLAAIIGATVLCGELSLMAALTNNGELIRSHLVIERGN